MLTKVHNVLRFGFLEKCYENALVIELKKHDLNPMQQTELDVWYEDQIIGHCIPDIWLPEKLIIEVKSVQNLVKEHEVKLVHYLAATNINDSLLINFGQSVQVKRKFRQYKDKGSIVEALVETNYRAPISEKLLE